MTDVKCPLLWTHLCVNTRGNPSPCCEITTSPFDKTLDQFDSLEQALNSDAFVEMRQQMLAGDEPDICKSICYDRERAGHKSKRQREIEQYEQTFGHAFTGNESEQINLDEIKYFDLKPSNYCNSRCVMCNPRRSSNFAKEAQENSDYKGPILVGGWYEEAKSEIEPLYSNAWKFKLNGGETTVMPEFSDIVQAISDAGSKTTKLNLNINNTIDITKYKEQLSKINKVQIVCSIEAYGPANSYIRYPADWDIVYANLQKINQLAKDYDNIEMHVGMVVLSLNYLQFGDDYVKILQEFDSIVGTYIGHIHQPEALLVNGLPDNILKEGLENLKKHDSIVQAISRDREVTGIYNFYQDTVKFYEQCQQKGSSLQHQRLLRDRIEYFDRARNINIVDYIPWMNWLTD